MPGVRPLSQAPMVSLAIQRGSAAFSSPRAPGPSLMVHGRGHGLDGWRAARASRGPNG